MPVNKPYNIFFDRYRDFLKEWYLQDKAIATRFNLFSILKINWKEALVHTPFLAHLLNPQESHSQGDLFYKEFIKTVLPEKHQTIFLDITQEHLYIKDEEGTGNGQIDIFIHHKDKKNPFAIIIENKIFAGDQYQQLKRYYDHTIKNLGISPEKIKLLYLTPIESMPSDESLEKELKQQLIKEGGLISISYQYHIIQWLRNCQKTIEAPAVQYSLQQYILTLESLCYE